MLFQLSQSAWDVVLSYLSRTSGDGGGDDDADRNHDDDDPDLMLEPDNNSCTSTRHSITGCCSSSSSNSSSSSDCSGSVDAYYKWGGFMKGLTNALQEHFSLEAQLPFSEAGAAVDDGQKKKKQQQQSDVAKVVLQSLIARGAIKALTMSYELDSVMFSLEKNVFHLQAVMATCVRRFSHSRLDESQGKRECFVLRGALRRPPHLLMRTAHIRKLFFNINYASKRFRCPFVRPFGKNGAWSSWGVQMVPGNGAKQRIWIEKH